MRDHGVAHRTLACGTRLGVCNLRTSQCTMAFVVDRGPWGALDRKGEWHLRTTPLRPGEHYRGELDLLPGTYSAIALAGIEKVAYWPLAGAEPGRTREHLPPLRAGGRSPFAINLRSAGTTEPAYPPLRFGESAFSAPLALNVPAPPVAETIFPPLRVPSEAAMPPLRTALSARRR
jgi:hypothetical protein